MIFLLNIIFAKHIVLSFEEVCKLSKKLQITVSFSKSSKLSDSLSDDRDPPPSAFSDSSDETDPPSFFLKCSLISSWVKLIKFECSGTGEVR